MEALQCYASDSDLSDPENAVEDSRKRRRLTEVPGDKVTDAIESSSRHTDSNPLASVDPSRLLPPPPDLLTASNCPFTLRLAELHAGRTRSFPHVDGNYALHVYIPVSMPAIFRRQLKPLMMKAFSSAPELKPMQMDMISHPAEQSSYETKLAKEYHLSLSRTVPIRVHQINSIVAMLKNKFAYQKGFWLELDKWELFVNDDETRSFLSLEVVRKGLLEIYKQIQLVDEVFQLHNLPVYYKTPRPHVSVAWALGKETQSLQKAVEDLKKSCTHNHVSLWSQFVKKIECKIGSQTYCIWKEKPELNASF